MVVHYFIARVPIVVRLFHDAGDREITKITHRYVLRNLRAHKENLRGWATENTFRVRLLRF